MLLEYTPDRPSTDDVDTWIVVRREVRERFDEIVSDIAVMKVWPRDWLNDKVATNAFFPEDVMPEDSHVIIEHGDVEVRVAEPATLFVMKLRAARPQRDFRDLSVLADICGIASRADAVDLYERRYPEHELKPSAYEWFDVYFGPEPT